MADKTHSNYHRWVARLIDYFNPEDVRTLTLFDAQDYLIELTEKEKYADSSYNGAVEAIRFFFAAVLGIDYSPKQLCKRKIEIIQKNPIMPAQARQLLDNCSDPQLKAYIALAFSCGLRSIEIVRLTFKDINKGSQTLTIHYSKGKRTRTVPYPPAAAEILNEYFLHCQPDRSSPENYVFQQKKRPGKRLNTSAVTNSFVQYLQTFSFYLPDQTFHGLRHAFATALAENNIPLIKIQKLMGHASIATTALYIHVPPVQTNDYADVITGVFYETEF